MASAPVYRDAAARHLTARRCFCAPTMRLCAQHCSCVSLEFLARKAPPQPHGTRQAAKVTNQAGSLLERRLLREGRATQAIAEARDAQEATEEEHEERGKHLAVGPGCQSSTRARNTCEDARESTDAGWQRRVCAASADSAYNCPRWVPSRGSSWRLPDRCRTGTRG